MAKELRQKLGSMEYDGLITGLNPPTRVDGGTIAKLAAPATLKRGTLLGKADSGLLSIYDGTGTPDCILCDDTEVGTAEDVPVDVYVAGCFDPEKVTVGDGYTITQADKDKLRTYSIVFKAATPAP
jgi:hypothetical protein